MLDKRVTILLAPYYPEVSDLLHEGARRVLEEEGVAGELLSVTGALELPQAMAMLGEEVEGVVALGCVLRGETAHFDLVSRLCLEGLQRIALQRGICMGSGVLACETLQQARLRASPQGRDVGGQAARACLSLLALKARLS